MGTLNQYGKWVLALPFIACLLGATNTHAAACISAATGNWNAAATWAAPCNVAGGPVAGDTVTIAGAHTVTVTANAAAASVAIALPSVAAHGLNLNPGVALNVTGAVTLVAPTTNSRTSILAVGGGNLSAASITINGGTTATRVSQVTVGTGTITTTGSIASGGTAAQARFISTGASTVNVGGNFTPGSLATTNTGTINFNGSAAQTMGAFTTYNNVTVNKAAGILSLSGTTTIGGTLDVAAGTYNLGAFTFQVNGATTIDGTLSISSATGTKTFVGSVTINPTGIWTNTTEAVTFQGGLIHNGAAFTAGTGVYTFSTAAAQSISCATALAIPNLTITTPSVVTNNCANLTVATALAGNGGLTNIGTLNLGGTSAITTLTANTVGNTVNYTGAAQTVKATSYHHLGLGGSGAKTLTGVTTIAGNLTMSGTATASAAAAMTIGGKFTIGATNTFTNGTLSVSVAGDFDQNGTFTAGAGVFTLNGGAALQTISGTGALGFANLTVSNTGGITLARNVTVTGAITGAVTLTSTCPVDYTLTSNGGATVAHSCNQVNSINRAGVSPTMASSVSWTVIFGQSVSGVTAGNFSLVSNGLGGVPAITSVTGSGMTRTVTASTGTGSGTLGLDMVNSTGVTPAVNYLPFTGQVYTLDRVAPTVSSIARVNASPTSLASVSWTVTFSKSVTGVDATDFVLVQSGGVSGAAITAVTPVSGTTYTVTASTGTGDGSLGLSLADNDSIVDAPGNPLGGAGVGNGDFTGEAYVISRPRVYYMYFNTGTKLTQPNVTTNTACPTAASDTAMTTTPGIGLMADVDDLTCVPGNNRDVTWSTATPTLSMYYNGAKYAAAKDVTGISVGIRVRSNTATATLTARLFYTTSANAQVYFSGAAATQAVTSTRTEYTISLAGQSATNVPAGSKIGIEFSWDDPLGVRLAVNASINSEKLIVLEADTAAAPDHLEIQHTSGTGVTCTPSTLTIKACADVACTAYTAGTGGISGTLSATGTGMTVNWSGGADFVIPAGSSSVTKDVQVTTVGSVTFGATSSSITGATTCNFGTAPGNSDCVFTAADSGFLVSVPNHFAATAQTLTLKAVKKAGNSPICVPGLTGSKTVNLKCAYTNPGSGSLPVRVAGTALNAGADAAAACDAGGANIGLTFSAAGVATPALQYADVGQVTLTASYSGAAGGMESGLAMSGAGSFIAAPAAFEVINQTAGTIRAGAPFSVAVRALNAAASPQTTPNFGKEGEGVTVSSILIAPDPATFPAAGNPALGNNLIAGTEFGAGGMDTTDLAGEATVTNLSWGEVGTIRLAATLTSGDYLGSGFTASGSDAGTTGPFIPDHFDTAVVATATTPMPCPAGVVCPALFNGFVYSGQPFSVQVTARNLAGGTTTNYDDTFGLSNDVTLTAWDAQGSTTTENPGGGALANDAMVAADFAAGVATIAAPTYTFAAVTAPTNIFVRAADTDGVSSVSGAEGGVMVASGRIKLSNGHGSELLPLPLTATVQYWNGTFWVASATDAVTALAASDFALAFPAGTVAKPNNMAACETVLTIVGASPVFALNLSTPGSGNNGWANLTLNLGAAAAGNHCAEVGGVVGGVATTANRPWLQFPAGANPAARATFGVYRGNNEFIYMRENY